MVERAHIATRRVLLIPGFDPNPPRAHRERYRREGAKQAAISGYSLTLSADPGNDTSTWDVACDTDGTASHARVKVLVWSDLVRAAMHDPALSGATQIARTAWAYLRSGALRALLRLRKGPVIAALYPPVAICLQWVVATALSFAIAGGLFLAAGTALPVLFPEIPPFLLLILRVAASMALFLFLETRILRWFKARDGKLLAHYLMQDYAYAASENGAYPEAMAERLGAFTEAVIRAAAEPVEETLLVGHSSGAYLAVTVLADALRSGRMRPDARVALLTLGHVVPMVSLLPEAHRLRADLAYLSASDRIAWVDVTAPGDGCSFALCDPVAVSGVAPEGKRWPLVISAAFTQTLSPETWARLRWRFFRLHFQYMCAFDRPGDYDFFAITAGPLSLADRFADRAPSPGRIETAVNRHTSLAP